VALAAIALAASGKKHKPKTYRAWYRDKPARARYAGKSR
jgi:hypothetical protein